LKKDDHLEDQNVNWKSRTIVLQVVIWDRNYCWHYDFTNSKFDYEADYIINL